MSGYDWPRLHAALNDLPAALLLVAVAFEIAGLAARRESLRTAALWTLVTGLVGTAAAVVAGLMAEDLVDHDDLAHELMERHKTLGLITLGVFALLTLWRVARRSRARRGEQAMWSIVGAAGVALLVATAQLGGSLTFDHGLGLSSATMRRVLEERGEPMSGMPPGDSVPADTAAAAEHHDRPGAAPHTHSKRPPQP